MSLKIKLTGSLLFIFLIVGVVNFTINRATILQSLVKIEKSGAIKDLNRITRAFETEVQALDSLCHDWSAWNYLYDYTKFQTDEFIKNNMSLSALKSVNINFLAIYNEKGKKLYSRIYDSNYNKRLKLKYFPVKQLPRDHFLKAFNAKTTYGKMSIKGIVSTSKGLMIMCSRPIITTEETGPAQGILVLGRFFDNKTIKKLNSITEVNFEVIQIKNKEHSENISNILNRLKEEKQIFQKNNKVLTCYTLIYDLTNNPGFLIKATITKSLSDIGYKALNYMETLTFIAGIILLIVLLFLLNSIIIKPIGKLSDHAFSIGKSGDLSHRITPKSKDEIGILTNEFNMMLENLEKREKELLESDERFRSLHNASFAGIVIHDKGVILSANKTLSTMSGYSVKELLKMNIIDLIAPENRDIAIANISEVDEHTVMDGLTITINGYKKDKTRFLVEFQHKKIPYYGKYVKITEIRDISKRIEMQKEIKQAHDELKIIFDNSPLGIILTKNERVIDHANQKASEMFGFKSPDEMVGASARIIHLSDEMFHEFGEKYRNTIFKGEPLQIEYQLKSSSGEPFWSSVSGKVIDSTHPPNLDKGVLWIIEDITQKKKILEQITKLATFDALTGIYNRRVFMEKAETEFKYSKRYKTGFSLIMIDIDKFKTFNDTYGHHVGDIVLKIITEILQKSLRDVDIFGRLGGEEFAVLLPSTGDEGAYNMAERLRRSVEKTTINAEGNELSITVSIGVGSHSTETENVDSIIKKADTALYRAKDNGRNRVEMF
ncbi:MAG: diguanylate cyclase [Desulfobacterales bacterium]|nr:diguanylate cyclase [Desulfobacterales bacterium]MCP4161515.1 diguanylate cyclase [Deltaproteobacteria bacterium]